MKIVYYTDQIYKHGGLERVLANKLNYLSTNTDIDLHVITFQQEGKPPCYPINTKVLFHDLKINYNRELSFLNPANIKYAPKHYLRLRSKIKEIDPDVVVVCNYEYGFYFIPLIAKKALKIKEYHSSGHFNYVAQQENKSFLKHGIDKITDYFESKYDFLVLLTKDELKYHPSKNKIAIPNAITSVNPKSADLNSKRAISAGRIAPVKGYENLITAWKFVNEKYPDWILDIYGDGELEYVNQLKRQIAILDLKDHVFFKGVTKDMEKEMMQSSIYVMSSLTECFPMVLLEAMSCGVPCVSFDCPNGPRNIIKHNVDGLLVEYLNNEALGNSIIELIKDHRKRKALGKQAKTNVQLFSEKNIMPLWLKIFSKQEL